MEDLHHYIFSSAFGSGITSCLVSGNKSKRIVMVICVKFSVFLPEGNHAATRSFPVTFRLVTSIFRHSASHSAIPGGNFIVGLYFLAVDLPTYG